MSKTPFSMSFDLPFLEAAEIASARLPMLPSEYYSPLMDGARRSASTVSNLASMQQIKDVLDSLHSAMVTGGSLKEWKKWASEQEWGLSDAHLSTIYRTNVQTAYMSGHVRGFEVTAKERPYLLYSAINDSRTRPTHKAMSGYIARYDDPIWRKWTPPCGYNCRCSLVSLTEEQAQQRGYGKQSNPGVEPDAGFGGDPRDHEEQVTKSIGEFGKTMPDEIARRSAQILANLPVQVDDYIEANMKKFVDGFDLRIAREAFDESVRLRMIPNTVTFPEFFSMWDYSGTSYRQINPVLWHTNVASKDFLTQKYDFRRVQAVALNNMLAKLPAYEGRAVRMVKTYNMTEKQAAAFYEAHKTGNVVQYEAFSSTSRDEETWSGNVKLIITSRTGRDIDALSRNQGENEILFAAGSRFRVVRAARIGGTLTITMEDVTGLDVQTTHLFVVEHNPTVHRHAKHSRALTPAQKKSAIEDRWQHEMTPPEEARGSFAAMCAMYPQFADAARVIGTLK